MSTLYLHRVNFGSYILYGKNNIGLDLPYQIDKEIKMVNDYVQIENNKMGIKKHDFERLLKNGACLFVYFCENYPTGMMWGHRGSCFILGPGIPLHQKDDTVYWFWIVTIPEARGRNVFTMLRNTFFNYYSDVKYFTALVAPDNKVMRHQMVKMAFKEIKKFYFFKFGSKSFLIEKCNKSNHTRVRIIDISKQDMSII